MHNHGTHKIDAVAALLGMAAAFMPGAPARQYRYARPAGAPCVKERRAKRKVRARMRKISQRRNRAG